MKKLRENKGPLTEIASHLKQKAFDMEELVADGIGLEKILFEDMKQFPNLQSLFIPRNKLKILENLDNNYRITFLDARDNQISDLNMPKNEYIRELYLSGNMLHDFDRTLAKMIHMKDLETLDFRGNPLTLEKGYKQNVIAMFPCLKILDGLEVIHPKKKKISNNSSNEFGIRQLKSKDRPRSVLQCLLTRPLSAADTIVKIKSDQIRYQQKMKVKRTEEEQTAVARKRKEEFEEAAKKPPPFPDTILELENRNKNNTKEIKSDRKRSSTRMFLKTPVYTVYEGIPDNLEIAAKLNPGLPINFIFTRSVDYKNLYPK